MKNSSRKKVSFQEKMQEQLHVFLKSLQTKKFWLELFIMTAGMFLSAIGVYFFLIPSQLIVGSSTGLCIVLAKLIPFVSVGTMIFVTNAILLLIAFVLIGNEFGAKTVYSALILGPMIDFLGYVYPIKESLFTTYLSTGEAIGDPWLDLLTFILIVSASQSILFSINASTGGLDIVAKILNKFTHMKLGTAVSVSGAVVCATAFLINSVQLVIIGFIGTWLNGLIVDYFMAGLNSRIRICIISDDYKKIQDYVVNTINRGVTLHEIIGGYSNKKRIELEIVLQKDEFSKLIDFMSREHISTFITSNKVSEVYGLWNKKGLLRTGDY